MTFDNVNDIAVSCWDAGLLDEGPMAGFMVPTTSTHASAARTDRVETYRNVWA